jgi:uncharacterized protein (TIGR00255 family)
MTGYGSAEVAENGVTVKAEIRSVNSRFLEIVARLPRSLILKENEIKEIIRSKLSRGKVNVSLSVERTKASEFPVKLNVSAAKAYASLLNSLNDELRLHDTVSLNHILKFSEVLEVEETLPIDNQAWDVAQKALQRALSDLCSMRENEGRALEKDLRSRLQGMSATISEIEHLATTRVPSAREQLQQRITELFNDRAIIDNQRLELEIALLADKLDITEECVRFRSHLSYCDTLLNDGENAGRKLGFLLQEINREINTIGSKSNDANISHRVVRVKEELEKIREQLQNVE